jgi:hypothetical protein
VFGGLHDYLRVCNHPGVVAVVRIEMTTPTTSMVRRLASEDVKRIVDVCHAAIPSSAKSFDMVQGMVMLVDGRKVSGWRPAAVLAGSGQQRLDHLIAKDQQRRQRTPSGAAS